MYERVAVSNDELVTVRDAMRGLNRMVQQLANGEREQFVLMWRGRMVARLVPIRETSTDTRALDEGGSDA